MSNYYDPYYGCYYPYVQSQDPNIGAFIIDSFQIQPGMLYFDGTNVEAWVLRMEYFFYQNRTQPELRMRTASQFLLREAHDWYHQWRWEKWGYWMWYYDPPWEDFVRDVQARFKPSATLEPQSEFLRAIDKALEAVDQCLGRLKADRANPISFSVVSETVGEELESIDGEIEIENGSGVASPTVVDEEEDDGDSPDLELSEDADPSRLSEVRSLGGGPQPEQAADGNDSLELQNASQVPTSLSQILVPIDESDEAHDQEEAPEHKSDARKSLVVSSLPNQHQIIFLFSEADLGSTAAALEYVYEDPIGVMEVRKFEVSIEVKSGDISSPLRVHNLRIDEWMVAIIERVSDGAKSLFLPINVLVVFERPPAKPNPSEVSVVVARGLWVAVLVWFGCCANLILDEPYYLSSDIVVGALLSEASFKEDYTDDELVVNSKLDKLQSVGILARNSVRKFIDELDFVGERQGRSFNDERDQTLTQLLTEMDGSESNSKVIAGVISLILGIPKLRMDELRVAIIGMVSEGVISAFQPFIVDDVVRPPAQPPDNFTEAYLELNERTILLRFKKKKETVEVKGFITEAAENIGEGDKQRGHPLQLMGDSRRDANKLLEYLRFKNPQCLADFITLPHGLLVFNLYFEDHLDIDCAIWIFLLPPDKPPDAALFLGSSLVAISVICVDLFGACKVFAEFLEIELVVYTAMIVEIQEPCQGIGGLGARPRRICVIVELVCSYSDEITMVMLSAMGKTINKLLLTGVKVVSGGDSNTDKIDELGLFNDLHCWTLIELGINRFVVLRRLKGIAIMKDYLVSVGERMSTGILPLGKEVSYFIATTIGAPSVPIFPCDKALKLRSSQNLAFLCLLGQFGFLMQTFSVFDELEISVDVLASSEVLNSWTLDPSISWSSRLIQRELAHVVEKLENILDKVWPDGSYSIRSVKWFLLFWFLQPRPPEECFCYYNAALYTKLQGTVVDPHVKTNLFSQDSWFGEASALVVFIGLLNLLRVLGDYCGIVVSYDDDLMMASSGKGERRRTLSWFSNPRPPEVKTFFLTLRTRLFFKGKGVDKN